MCLIRLRLGEVGGRDYVFGACLRTFDEALYLVATAVQPTNGGAGFLGSW
jgi:hypothetical protein